MCRRVRVHVLLVGLFARTLGCNPDCLDMPRPLKERTILHGAPRNPPQHLELSPSRVRHDDAHVTRRGQLRSLQGTAQAYAPALLYEVSEDHTVPDVFGLVKEDAARAKVAHAAFAGFFPEAFARSIWFEPAVRANAHVLEIVVQHVLAELDGRQ